MQYIIKSGDTLSSIAQEFYGDWRYYPAIVNANSIIKNADQIEAGWTITIPGTPKMGPIKPGDPSMTPPAAVAAPPMAPTASLPAPMPGSAPAARGGSNGMVYLALVAASLALGYMLVKNYVGKEEAPTVDEEAAEETVEAV